MNNHHWGGFTDDSKKDFDTKKKLDIPYPEQRFSASAEVTADEADDLLSEKRKPKKRYVSRNRILKQTIEVMDQTDIIKDLIETYKPGNNYGFNPYQMALKLEVRTSSEQNLVKDTKFIKPLWFIPPVKSKFLLGQPKEYNIISKKFINSTLRRSLAGLLRIHNFKNSTNSALVLFVDAIDEFFKNFMNTIRLEMISGERECETQIDIITLEKSYQIFTKKSLLTLHNYYKNNMVKRNRKEVDDFKNYSQEYDKIIQMNQKPPNIKEEDLASYLDYTDTNNYMNNPDNSMSVSNIFETGEQEGLGDIFDFREIPESGEENLNLSVPPPSVQN